MNNYSERELHSILGHFSIPEKKYGFSALTNGYINDTFLVSEDGSPQYILQRVNHKVFQNIDGVMNNIERALNQLDAPNYAEIGLIHTTSKKTYLEKKGNGRHFWRMLTYIPNSTTHNTTENPIIAFEAGRIIGRFHQLLKDVNKENYIDTIPRFHDLTFRKEQFNESLKRAAEKKKTAASAILFAEETLTNLEKIDIDRLPLRICHNDTKLNNILFSKETNKALCLIDLDTLMKGHFLYDFGDAVRTIANTAPEDEQVLDKITFEKALFEAFLDGLATHKGLLSTEEIGTLHWGVILMPFLHGIRALTDYLNGNIYYKVAYKNQNLDRCKSLFQFTQIALGEINYMKKKMREKFI